MNDIKSDIIVRISGPNAGIANRMHGYAHAKIFANLTNTRLLIYDNHNGFRNDLYNTINDIFEIEFNFIKKRSTVGLKKPWDSSVKYDILRKLEKDITESEYCKLFLNNFLDFKFVKSIQQQADFFTEQSGISFSDTIGVHIRTERGRAKARYFDESDSNKCVETIIKYLGAFDLKAVFLTGGKLYGVMEEVKSKLKHYGVNVISDDVSVYSRDSIEWLRDMEILSRCQLVMGHMHSTFATASARIKAKKFIDLKIGAEILPPYTH